MSVLIRHRSTMEKVEEKVDARENHRDNKANSINLQFTTKETRVKLKPQYELEYLFCTKTSSKQGVSLTYINSP